MMTAPQPALVWVLYHEGDPDLGAPTKVLGAFRSDPFVTGLDHAQARAALLLGAHNWRRIDDGSIDGLGLHWESGLGWLEGTAVIEPHALEPIPAPMFTTRRPRSRQIDQEAPPQRSHCPEGR